MPNDVEIQGPSGEDTTDGLHHSMLAILDQYGDKVSINAKRKGLLKFGSFANLGTSVETVQSQGGNETYCTTNAITHFSSSNSGDTRDIVVEGHTISNGLLTFVTQTVTLFGQTKTALTTPLARATRVYNDGTVDFAGTVYIYEDDTVSSGVPQTASKLHLQSGARNQGWKASTSLSSTDYMLVTDWYMFVNRKTAASADFVLESRQVSTSSKVFRPLAPGNANSAANPTILTFNPPLIVPKNSDIRTVASASTTSVEVTSFINGYLAKVIA